MKKKFAMVLSLVAVLSLVSACASSNSSQKSLQYPPTAKVEPIFQVSQAPASCRVFSHLFATIPPNMMMNEFTDKISGEAKSKGADMMLIGQSRQCTTETSLTYS